MDRQARVQPGPHGADARTRVLRGDRRRRHQLPAAGAGLRFHFHRVQPRPSAALFPAHLARVLRAGHLKELVIRHCYGYAAVEGDTAAAERGRDFLCAALRASQLEMVWLQDHDEEDDGRRMPANLGELLEALAGHLTLRALTLGSSSPDRTKREELATRIEGMIAAANSSPALRTLDISNCELDAEGLGRIFDALRSNTHLTALECKFWQPIITDDDGGGEGTPIIGRAQFARASESCPPCARAPRCRSWLRWDSSGSGDAGQEIDEIMRGRRWRLGIGCSAPPAGAGARE